MLDFLRLVSEADRRTLPALSLLSEDDINCIWGDVSSFIERQMTLQKRLDIGNRFTMIQRPIFLLSGKLAQSLGLKQVRPLAAATHLPVVQLNYAAVSQESPFSRDVVEGCVRETLLLLCRALASEQHALLTFQGIGVLSFKNNKVRMKFNRDFINAMDGTGRLLLAFNKRPGSSVSLLSSGPASRLQRPQTANPVTLPSICSPCPDNKAGDKDAWCSSPALHQRNAGEVPQQRESKSHQPLQPAKMKAVRLSEEPDPKPPTEAAEKPTAFISPLEGAPKLQEPLLNVACSGHTRAGQELCYLCMQRAQRNVPVYLRKQQEAEERAQEKLLLLEEQQRDRRFMEEEQRKLDEQREHAKQVATFNLQVNKERKEQSLLPVCPTSFIFPTRPLTATRRIQQHHYMSDLQSQIQSRRQHEAQDQHSRLLMERLDQVQLVQELALQKAQQLQQKHQRTTCYKRALDTQVGDKKSSDPPQCQVDGSGFPRCEMAASNMENRERAQKVFQDNFSTATQKKTDAQHQHQEQLEEEKEMLQHNRMEFILGRINRSEQQRDVSRSLEDDWSRCVRLKHDREEEEKRFLRSAGELLVDKLSEFRRCCQCKRRTTNCGESNIWKDSRYLSGSQFMI
ncbi:coiled-coil domain-containing protein 81-like isoform X2 [Notolabrus celidotus]|uniref:coiled-coil domain-containing protein 81-like isoform X2 n=1 Tax=Notolabrus celidotus TaxID=1203425 RepID=UPI00148F8864|nr:coiled-coil domain-containing protein 81-like isoform X2 [Notolabrus celidotus]